MKTIRVTFSHGVFKPLERVDYPENKEFKITIEDEKEEWSSFANTSFARDWENDKDMIYDDWKEHYKIP